MSYPDEDQALWFTFELSGDSDLHNALDYLGAIRGGMQVHES